MRENKNLKYQQPKSLPVMFILYIIAASAFQILFISGRYGGYDSVWKVLVLLSSLIYTAFTVRRNPTVKIGYWVTFIGLLLYQILSVFLTNSIPSSMQQITFMLFPPVIFFIYFILLGKAKLTELDIRVFLKAFVIYVIYACAVNLFINRLELSSISLDTKAYEYAFSSFFENRNTFGFYLFLGSASSLYLLYRSKKRLFALIAFSLLLLNLVLTLSRSSILGLIVFILFFALLSKDSGYRLKLAILGLFTFTTIMLVPTANNFASNNILRSDAGLSGRDRVYAHALQSIDSHNIIVGAGQEEPYQRLKEKTDLTSFHSTYLTLLVTGGITYLLLFVLAISFSIKKISIVYKNDIALGAFFGSMLAAYLVYSFAESLVLFMPSVSNFIATLFIIIMPFYASNFFTSRELGHK